MKPEVGLVLQMLSSTAAWGVMRICQGTCNVSQFLQQVQLVNGQAAALGQLLCTPRADAWAAAAYYGNWYPGYYWGGWPMQATKEEKKSKKSKKDKKNKKKKDKKSKATAGKRKASSSSEESSSRPVARGGVAHTPEGPCAAAAPAAAMEEKPKSVADRLAALLDSVEERAEPGPSAAPTKRPTEAAAPAEVLKPQAAPPGPSEVATEKEISASSHELQMRHWLESLDSKGSLLQYLPKLKEEFDADLGQLTSVRLANAEGGVLSSIDSTFWQAIGVVRMGHRLLLAKAILAL
ncbi:unnamed protein product [Effrenium voratum]|nr:unnamed protein product [Effrenium voratum]